MLSLAMLDSKKNHAVRYEILASIFMFLVVGLVMTRVLGEVICRIASDRIKESGNIYHDDTANDYKEITA